MVNLRRTQTVSGIGVASRSGGQASTLATSAINLDWQLATLVGRIAIPAIRLSLAIIFVWFGALKVIGPNSAFHLVTDTLSWFPADPNHLVPYLGLGEMIMGFGLLFGRGVVLRVALIAFFTHMGGTFLVLPILPDVAFREGNPLLLTKLGEYVVKNVVFIAAALALYASDRASRHDAD